jgi:DNA-binding NtrC family response regulator
MKKSEKINPPVLLVDDEDKVLISYGFMLRSAGITDIASLEDPRRVMPFLSKKEVSVIVLDLTMPFISGKELLERIRKDYPQIPVIVATATNEVDTAVECMLAGACDYLVKPIEKNRLISSIRKVLELRQLETEVSALKDSLLTRGLKKEEAFSHFITGSQAMISIFKYIEAIADSPFPVLILGETGVGKELIAKAIHLSSSASKNLVLVNVSGLDDTLFTDTLFGHTKGAFTGAGAFREGLITQAEGGTLFLDEIGDLSAPSQVKLLRLIQEKEYYPLGSDLAKKTDCRIIAATNRDIKDRVNSEVFRKDLYYRFLAHQITIPPLRDRREDIPILFDFFLNEAAKDLHKKIPTHPPELITLLKSYNFPGNVRELQALVYDAMSRYESGMLPMASFKTLIELEKGGSIPANEGEGDTGWTKFLDGFPTLDRAEEYLIDRALHQAEGNQGIAASMLGISRQALNKRLQRKKHKPNPTRANE